MFQVLTKINGEGNSTAPDSGAGVFKIHIQAVPEPGSLVMMGVGGGLGLVGLLRRRRARVA
jgi:hypothetical protein